MAYANNNADNSESEDNDECIIYFGCDIQFDELLVSSVEPNLDYIYS